MQSAKKEMNWNNSPNNSNNNKKITIKALKSIINLKLNISIEHNNRYNLPFEWTRNIIFTVFMLFWLVNILKSPTIFLPILSRTLVRLLYRVHFNLSEKRNGTVAGRSKKIDTTKAREFRAGIQVTACTIWFIEGPRKKKKLHHSCLALSRTSWCALSFRICWIILPCCTNNATDNENRFHIFHKWTVQFFCFFWFGVHACSRTTQCQMEPTMCN